MKIRSLLTAILLFSLQGQANAAQVWVNNLTVDSYRVYYTGADVVFEVKFKEDITGTGCAITDTNNVFSYWAANNTNAFHQMLQAQTMMAEASGRKIDIMYENTQCSAVAGRLMYGIRVQPIPVP